MTKIFYPELDFAISKYEKDIFFCEIEGIEFGNTDSNLLSTTNLFYLLFTDEYNYATVTTVFREILRTDDEYFKDTSVPQDIRYRTQMFPDPRIRIADVQYSDNAKNDFEFNAEDLKLIEEYRKYKHGDSYDLSTVNFTLLTNLGKNIYNVFQYETTKTFMVPPENMYSSSVEHISILCSILRIKAAQLEWNDLIPQSSTFLKINEKV